MKPTLFISDLHLSPARPHINRLFFDFLRGPAVEAQALYILGDLFEYWAGDDDLADPFNADIAASLRALSNRGVPLYFMHGNRDFLCGDEFARVCGLSLLPDPTLIDLHGTPTLLMHGDTLCTDDLPYQAFRKQVRDPAWQRAFLAQPLPTRKALIEKLRLQTEQEKQGKTMEIMDVTLGAVTEVLGEHKVTRLIHGHTHRPAHHIHEVGGEVRERWVLHDWYDHPAYLRCDVSACSSVELST